MQNMQRERSMGNQKILSRCSVILGSFTFELGTGHSRWIVDNIN